MLRHILFADAQVSSHLLCMSVNSSARCQAARGHRFEAPLERSRAGNRRADGVHGNNLHLLALTRRLEWWGLRCSLGLRDMQIVRPPPADHAL